MLKNYKGKLEIKVTILLDETLYTAAQSEVEARSMLKDGAVEIVRERYGDAAAAVVSLEELEVC